MHIDIRVDRFGHRVLTVAFSISSLVCPGECSRDCSLFVNVRALALEVANFQEIPRSSSNSPASKTMCVVSQSLSLPEGVHSSGCNAQQYVLMDL